MDVRHWFMEIDKNFSNSIDKAELEPFVIKVAFGQKSNIPA
jgi:hypothetical protein